jgi:MoxR-like ATPase
VATLQPLSRVGRLREAAEALLATPSPESTAEAENVLREIDANFPADKMPAQLADLRTALMKLVVTPA